MTEPIVQNSVPQKDEDFFYPYRERNKEKSELSKEEEKKGDMRVQLGIE